MTAPCPTLETLFKEANTTLADTLTVRGWFGTTDTDLLEQAFPDWVVLGSTDRVRDYGGHRALLKHQTHPWYLLAHTNAHRLLPTREWCADRDFRLPVNDANGPAFMVGTEDDLIAYTANRWRRAIWSLDHLKWVFNLVPGERADAEAMLLNLEGPPHPMFCRCNSCLSSRR